jgi:uncharacterized membrane protein YeiH
MPLWVEHFAVAVCAISGVLAAEGRRMDLFGALVLALVTAVGGGTIRDLCLGVEVFWIKNPAHVTTALVAALVTFVLVRFIRTPHRALLIADAFGLALFGIVGTEKALILGSPGLVAIMMGVITGVAGGMIRDVLTGEIPLVFRPHIHLYATAAMLGAGVFVLAQKAALGADASFILGALVTLALRLAAIRWRLALPVFRDPAPRFIPTT